MTIAPTAPVQPRSGRPAPPLAATAGIVGLVDDEDKEPFPLRAYDYGDTRISILAGFTSTLVMPSDDCETEDTEDFMVEDYKEECKKLLTRAVEDCKLPPHSPLSMKLSWLPLLNFIQVRFGQFWERIGG